MNRKKVLDIINYEITKHKVKQIDQVYGVEKQIEDGKVEVLEKILQEIKQLE